MPKTVNKVSFTIPYPRGKEKAVWSRCYGLNAYYAGKHWTKRKADCEFWHMLTRSCLPRNILPKEPFKEPVRISFFWDDGLDCSNHAVMAKMIEDSLKGLVIVDDNRRYVKEIHHYFWDEGAIGVTVSEIAETKKGASA